MLSFREFIILFFKTFNIRKINHIKLQLKDVTLLSVDGCDIKRLEKPLEICLGYCNFTDIKIITDLPYNGNKLNEFLVRPNFVMDSVKKWSYFMLKKLNDFIETDFVLYFHHDGFILNPAAWTDEFLQYDYIGAPWKYYDSFNVGNGGFSLRSKKLLETTQHFNFPGEYNSDDHLMIREHGPALVKQGIKFAPEELAQRFSFEANGKFGNKWSGQLGFHNYSISDIRLWEGYENFISGVYERKN